MFLSRPLRLLNYLTKYLTKAEITSADMAGVVDTVLRSDPTAKASSVYIKLLNRSHNRDYSAQEVAHHVLKLPGYHCSHTFTIASASDEIDIETGRPVPSAYNSYLARAQTMAGENFGNRQGSVLLQLGASVPNTRASRSSPVSDHTQAAARCTLQKHVGSGLVWQVVQASAAVLHSTPR